jgi:hypothetical protein
MYYVPGGGGGGGGDDDDNNKVVKLQLGYMWRRTSHAPTNQILKHLN